MKSRFINRIAASSAAIFVCASTATQADQTWTGATDALWTTTTNWTTTSPGASDVAIFNASSTANLATTLGADFSVLGVRVVDPTAAVSVATGSTLTIGASGIDMSAATQNLTIGSTLVLNSAQAWNVTTGRTLTVSGNSTGSAVAFTKSGAGIVQLNAPQLSASGSVLLSGGETRANAGNFVNVFNSAPITFENGASLVHWNGSSTVTLLSSMVVASGQSGTINMGGRMGWGNNTDPIETLTGGGTLNLVAATTISRDDISADMTAFTGTINFSGSGSVRLFINGGKVGAGFTNSTVDLAGSVNLNPQTNTGGNTINVNTLTGSSATATLGAGSSGAPNYSVGASGASTTFAGGIRGNAILTKVGAGTLTLTNTTLLDATGATNVNGGTLKMMGTKTGTGATTVNTGGTLTGTGSLTSITTPSTTTIASGGTLAPGDGGVGNITHSSLTLASGSILDIEFGVGNDTATVSTGGTLTLTGGATVDVNGFDTEGTYTIINTTGATVSGTASTALSAIGGNNAKVYTFADTGTAITMTISGSDPTNYWNVNGTGTWEAAGNWTKNAIPNASEAIAKIGPGVGGQNVNFTDLTFPITLDANQTVGTLAFDDANGTSVVIDPGLTTPGGLLFNNGASASILANIAGNHVINAVVVVDAEDLAVDVGNTYMLTLNGEVSGPGAAIVKNGAGILALMGTNTYDGGTTLSVGSVRIGTLTSLGATSGAATFAGGTLQLGAAVTGDTRSLLVSGASNAIIDTNNFAYAYDGVIAPTGGGTGGLNKIGGGTLTLTAPQTYTGATNVNGGTLVIAGGSITAGLTGSVTSAALTLSSGSLAFNAGLNGNSGNPSSAMSISLTGGSFSASSLTMGRCTLNSNVIYNPTAGRTESGLYVNGTTANITGALTVGLNNSATNSTASARIDSGSLTVGGTVLVSVNSPDRWSVLDVNGGTFTSTDAVTGVQIGSGQTGSDAFLVRNGIATVERILLTQPAASTETSLLNVSGGTLYVGSGGIVGNNNGGTGVLDVQLGTATLGAKATWSTALGATLNTTTVIKAADAADAAFNISIAGVLGGTGGLEKTGAGTLTLSGTNIYQGTTLVSAGNLAVTGNSSGVTGAVTVASGATLSGGGDIGGDVTIDSTGHHALAVADAVANQITRVITGALTMTSGNILDLSAAVTPAPGTYVLATANGGITGTIPNTTVNYNGITGTVAIVGNNLVLTVSGASSYDSWASTNGVAGQASNLDHDNDGVANGVEYFIGGPTGNTTGFTPLPGVTTAGAVRSVTWTHAATYTGTYGTDFVVQTSPTLTLGSWTNEPSPGNVAIVGDNVTYTFPAGPLRNFVRLVVTP